MSGRHEPYFDTRNRFANFDLVEARHADRPYHPATAKGK
jgi:hypothetical protein